MTEREELPAGLLVIAGVRTLDEADPSTGWLEAAPVGALDRRLLVQDSIWIDPLGGRHRLEDLTDERRSHILETLIDMELELEMVSRVRVGSEMASGALDVQTALRDLDAIGALGRRWVETTPLVKRLAALNGITFPERQQSSDHLPPQDPPPALVAPSTARTALHDHDAGLWSVSTETSTYLIDLDLRMLLRAPGAVRGSHINLDGEVVWAYEFENDRAWQRLTHLNVCRLGDRMEARVVLGGREETIRSTAVTIIELAEPP